MDAGGKANAAMIRLHNEFKELSRNDGMNYSVGLVKEDLFKWRVTLYGPSNTDYSGGLFIAILTFTKDYPFEPPTMTFQSQMWHPNIYKDGKVCISILHKPEVDSMGYEHIDERWSPAQSVHSVLMSVICMLGSPNDESPANVDAAKMLRENKSAYRREVQRCVERSLDI